MSFIPIDPIKVHSNLYSPTKYEYCKLQHIYSCIEMLTKSLYSYIYHRCIMYLHAYIGCALNSLIWWVFCMYKGELSHIWLTFSLSSGNSFCARSNSLWTLPTLAISPDRKRDKIWSIFLGLRGVWSQMHHWLSLMDALDPHPIGGYNMVTMETP